MTLLLLESFDGIATADLPSKGWTNSSATVTTVAARTGPNALRASSANAAVSRGLAAADEHATLIVGFAFYMNAASGVASRVVSLRSDGGATTHITLSASVGGLLQVRRGTETGTILGSGSTLVAGQWYYLELKVTLSDASGVVELKVNGAADITLSGQDTKNAGTKTVFDNIIVGNSGASTDYIYDDLYLCNAAGSVNNTFLGDTRVRCLLPNGNGNSSQLLGSDGNSTDNYLLVDEAVPSTADYVGSATLDQKDTYTFNDLPDASGTIHGVQVAALATKTDAAARNLAIVTRSGGTDYDGSDVALALGTNAYVRQVRETDPATAAAWSIAGVNAAEFGAKVR